MSENKSGKPLFYDPSERRIRSFVTRAGRVSIAQGRALEELGPRYGTTRAERRASTMLYFGMINWTHTWYEPDGPVDTDALADRAVAIWVGR